MKNLKFLFIFLLSVSMFDSYAQQGYKMKLIANLNQHPPGANYSALWGYESNGREYAILGAGSGTAFIDVTDTNNIHEIAFLPDFFSGWREMKVYSHYAYIVSEAQNSHIQIVDLQYLPDSIKHVGRYQLAGHSSTHSISQSGPYLYLHGANPSFGIGVVIVDLSVNPEAPVLRGNWSELYVHDSRIVNDTIYACNIGNQKVSIINAVNKNNPQLITQFNNFPIPASPHNCALTADGKYLYVTDENFGPGKLKIWDIEDIFNPIYIRSWNPLGFSNAIIHNIEIYGNLAVIAYYTAGVRLLDISDPINPVEIAWYDTYPENNSTGYSGCWGVYMFQSGKIIASDMQRGLFVLKPQLNQNPSVPVADFYAEATNIHLGESINLLDISLGNPTSRQWTITNGNVTYTSSEPNPLITFNETGQYSVKLRVSNSLGSDSIIRNNFITVNNPLLSQFQFIPNIFQTVYSSPTDTSTVKYNWTRSNPHPMIFYNVKLSKVGTTSERIIRSDNNGSDSVISVRKSYLDSLAVQFGTVNDSVLIRAKVWAYNGSDSLSCGNQLLITVKRNSVGITTLSTEIPKSFDLKQNYPNPFNPETKINFDLPVASKVSIKVYDINGREVSTLLEDFQPAGYYSVSFNGSQLSSGIYFYTIRAGSFIATRKMLLVK